MFVCIYICIIINKRLGGTKSLGTTPTANTFPEFEHGESHSSIIIHNRIHVVVWTCTREIQSCEKNRLTRVPVEHRRRQAATKCPRACFTWPPLATTSQLRVLGWTEIAKEKKKTKIAKMIGGIGIIIRKFRGTISYVPTCSWKQ